MKKNGVVKVPDTIGLGATIDADRLASMEQVMI